MHSQAAKFLLAAVQTLNAHNTILCCTGMLRLECLTLGVMVAENHGPSYYFSMCCSAFPFFQGV